MRKFRERNLLIVAAIAAAVFIVAAFVALNFSHLPLISSTQTYRADMATAVGLQKGDVVTIAGVRVGSVTGLSLQKDKPWVRVSFTVDSGSRLGTDTRVDERIINPVGVQYLAVTPAGPGHVHGDIPVQRTTVPPTLISDLNRFTKQTQQTNIPQLVQSLEVVSQTLSAVKPADTRAAIEGVAALSQVLANRQAELSQVITQASNLTAELNQHSDQLVTLIGQADLVLQVLNQRKQAITTLLTTTSQLSSQISHLLAGDQPQLNGALRNLQTVSAVLAQDSSNIDQAIPLLAAFDRYTANVTGSGRFADFIAPTLTLPDNLLAQCSNAQISILLGCRS